MTQLASLFHQPNIHFRSLLLLTGFVALILGPVTGEQIHGQDADIRLDSGDDLVDWHDIFTWKTTGRPAFHRIPTSSDTVEINGSVASDGQTIVIHDRDAFADTLRFEDGDFLGRFHDDLEIIIRGKGARSTLNVGSRLDVFATRDSDIGTAGTTRVTLRDLTVVTPFLNVSSNDNNQASPEAYLILDNTNVNGGFALSSGKLDADYNTVFMSMKGGTLRSNELTSSLGERTYLDTSRDAFIDSNVNNNGLWEVTGNTMFSGNLRGSGEVVLLDNLRLVDDGSGEEKIISGRITGSEGGLYVDGGEHSLVIPQSFTGGLYLEGGMLNIDTANNTGGLSNNIHLNGGQLNVRQNTNLALAAWIANEHSKLNIQGDFVSIAGSVLGDGTIEKLGSGWLTFTGDNSTFDGKLLISEGLVRLGASNGLGENGDVEISEGAFMALTGDESFGSLSGNGSFVTDHRAISKTEINRVFSGSLIGNSEGSFSTRGDGSLTLTGSLSEFDGTLAAGVVGAPTGDDTGHLILTQNAMATMHSEALLRSYAGSTIELDTANSDATLQSQIGNFGSIVKMGQGTLTLTGTNRSSNGVTEVREGTLRSNSTYGSTLKLNGGGFEATGQLSIQNLEVGSSGGTLDTAGNFAILGGLSTSPGGLSGEGTLTKSGLGELGLTEAADNSAFTGTIDLQRGSLSTNSSLANATVNIGDQTTFSSSYMSKVIEVGAISGAGTLNTGNGDLRVGTNNQSTTFDGSIEGEATLVKKGTGTWTLTGDNSSFNSQMHVEQGTLAVENANSLGASTVLSDGATIKLTDSFALNGGQSRSISFDSVSGAGTVDTNGFDLTDARVSTGGGTIVKTGEGRLSLRSGTESFSGTYRVEGGSLASRPGPGARLELAGGEFVALSSNFNLTEGFHVDGGGAYNVGSGGNIGLNASITGDGTLAKTGNGRMLLGSDNSEFSGAYQVQQGILDFSHVDSLNNNDIEIQSGAIARINVAQAYSGSLSGVGNLSLSQGSGDVTLSGNNASFGGQIQVGSGRTLYAGVGNSLGNNTSLNIWSGGLVEIEAHEYWGGLSGNGTLRINAGTDVRMGLDHEDSFFSGNIVGETNFQKRGTGKLVFDGDASLLNGEFQVVNGSLTGSGEFGDLHVFAGATLSPGNSPGLVQMDSLILDAGSLLEIELGGLVPGTEFDQLFVSGDAEIDGDLSVALIDGFELEAGQSFLIGDVQGDLIGGFNGLGEGGFVGTYGEHQLFITYQGGSGNGISLFTSSVPEPSSCLLLASLMTCLAARRRRLKND
ncbi:MAG: autotransporter-associated beta strand repeat-containing protein [Planctomycetota bacterium]